MLTTSPRATAARLSPSMAREEAIEWEDLPSFANSLTKRLVMLGGTRVESGSPAWIETMAAELDLSPPSEPFREPLQGLQTREVHEPEVFRLFFGDEH